MNGAIGGYTQSRRPVTVVFTEEFPTRLEALEAERRIKGWARDKKEALIARDWALLAELAHVRGSRASPRTAAGQTPPRKADDSTD